MAKVVIAGASDCPHFGRIELLADRLASSLPDFIVTKIIKQPNEWKDFTNWLYETYNWVVSQSPVVWRELLHVGGKGTLIGGAGEFQEFVAAYYGEYSEMTSEEMLDVAKYNSEYKNQVDEEKRIDQINLKAPSKLVIFGAISHTTKYVLTYLANHDVFGQMEQLEIHLQDEETNTPYLDDLVSNMDDFVSPLVSKVMVVTDLPESLKNAKQLIFLNTVERRVVNFDEAGSYPEKSNTGITSSSTPALVKYESRKEWLARRYSYFSTIGLLIKMHCPSSIRILVTGNPGLDASSTSMLAQPINFDVAVLHRILAPKIQSLQVVGLAEPIERRVKSIFAAKLGVKSNDVTDVVVWGNVGSKIYPDLSNARVHGRQGTEVGIVADSWFSISALSVTRETDWFLEDLQANVYSRHTDRIPQRIGMNEAKAVVNHLRGSWIGNFDQKDNISSLVLVSQGWYNIPCGVVFSFPIMHLPKGCWSVVEDLNISTTIASELERCLESVLQDWSIVDPAPLEHFLQSRQGTSIRFRSLLIGLERQKSIEDQLVSTELGGDLKEDQLDENNDVVGRNDEQEEEEDDVQMP